MTPVETPSILMYIADLIEDWADVKGGPVRGARSVNVEAMEVYADPWIADVYLVKLPPNKFYHIDLVDGESVDECHPTTWPPTSLGQRWTS